MGVVKAEANVLTVLESWTTTNVASISIIALYVRRMAMTFNMSAMSYLLFLYYICSVLYCVLLCCIFQTLFLKSECVVRRLCSVDREHQNRVKNLHTEEGEKGETRMQNKSCVHLGLRDKDPEKMEKVHRAPCKCGTDHVFFNLPS